MNMSEDWRAILFSMRRENSFCIASAVSPKAFIHYNIASTPVGTLLGVIALLLAPYLWVWFGLLGFMAYQSL